MVAVLQVVAFVFLAAKIAELLGDAVEKPSQKA
jgi:hypothetical protein